MSKILFNNRPIVIDVDLANKAGLHEAIILQQMHYWIETNKERERNNFQGRYWTYNPISEWQKKFPFLTAHAVRKALEHLRDEKLLITGNFNKSRVDRTLWYTIEYGNLDKFMQAVVVRSTDESNEGQNGGVPTNAFDENNKCNDKKTTNAFDENNTPIPDNIHSINKKDIYIQQSEQIWKMYPNKKGKVDAVKKIPKLLEEHGYEHIVRCVERYLYELSQEQWKSPKHGSTFFNKGYVDYLDENYQETPTQPIQGSPKEQGDTGYDIPY